MHGTRHVVCPLNLINILRWDMAATREGHTHGKWRGHICKFYNVLSDKRIKLEPHGVDHPSDHLSFWPHLGRRSLEKTLSTAHWRMSHTML